MEKIGVLGGGQLGLMLEEAAQAMGFGLHFLDPQEACSCRAITKHVTLGSFADEQTVLDFGQDKDIITVEIEHVHVGALRQLEQKGVKVFPQPDVLELIQDKGLQKLFYQKHGIPSAPFDLVDSAADIDESDWPLPYVLKARRGGYDGKGVQLVKASNTEKLAGPLLVEKMADLKNELSVIVARSPSGEIDSFPVVEMQFDPEANLVSALISPADISEEIATDAREIAARLIAELDMVGLLAVEFFLLQDDTLWVNEVAPRPHNSGHQTIEGNITSQYTQHLLAITNQPLGDTSPKGYAAMINVLGAAGHTGPAVLVGADKAAAAGAAIHPYHKAETRPMRKMGHLTLVGSEHASTLNQALALRDEVRYESAQ